jgi:hypothetical protein
VGATAEGTRAATFAEVGRGSAGEAGCWAGCPIGVTVGFGVWEFCDGVGFGVAEAGGWVVIEGEVVFKELPFEESGAEASSSSFDFFPSMSRLSFDSLCSSSGISYGSSLMILALERL